MRRQRLGGVESQGAPIFSTDDDGNLMFSNAWSSNWREYAPVFPDGYEFAKPSVAQVEGMLDLLRKEVFKGNVPPFSRKQLRRLLMAGGYVANNGPAMVVDLPMGIGERELPTFVRLNWKALNEADKKFMRAALRTTLKQLEKNYQVSEANDQPIPSLWVWFQKISEFNLPF